MDIRLDNVSLIFTRLLFPVYFCASRSADGVRPYSFLN
jgi:hypothetical protein